MRNFTKINHYLCHLVKQDIIPGAVLCVAKGDFWYKKAFGDAQKYYLANDGCVTLCEQPILMTTAHLFDLASITKLFTSIGIMLLIDQQKIALDQAISSYLLDFNVPDKKTITVRHLLSHTSGLPAWQPLYVFVSHKAEAIRLIGQLGLESPVGQKRLYSDLGFMVLGYLIEYIAQQSLADFLDQYLFKKLGLSQQEISFNPVKTGEFNPHPHCLIAATSHGNPVEYAMSHAKENQTDKKFHHWRKYTLIGEVNDANAYHVFQGISGHAGLFSTAKALHKIIQVIINNGYDENKNKNIIKPETVQRFTQKDAFGHGLGFSMSDDASAGGLPLGRHTFESRKIIGHTGFTGAYVLAIPDMAFSMILLTNVQNKGINADGKYHSLRHIRENVLTIILNSLEMI